MQPGEGLNTDMRAGRKTTRPRPQRLRRPVDWGTAITAEERNLEFFTMIVKRSEGAKGAKPLSRNSQLKDSRYSQPALRNHLIHAEDLWFAIPDLPCKEGERVSAEYPAVFLRHRLDAYDGYPTRCVRPITTMGNAPPRKDDYRPMHA